MKKFDESERLTLRDRAYLAIGESLRTGRFEPGAKITIRGLAATLGISATPIREAIGRLVAEGAIEALPNKWMRVPLLSVEELKEIRDIRVQLEGRVTELAADRLTEAALRRCERAHNKVIELRGTGDVKGRIAHIVEFHYTIYEAAEQPISMRMIKSLWLRTGPYINLLFPEYSLKEQGKLRGKTLAALKKRDGARARAFMEKDIAGALGFFISLAEKGRIESAA